MARERDAEPVPQSAPVLAPAPAAAPSPAFAGIGFAPGSLTPGQAIALQRTAGNHAVTGLLSRQPVAAPAAPPPAGTAPGASATTDKGLKHADFSTTGGDPSTSGTVTVAAEGPGGVVLNAPKITADGGVTWAAPPPPDPAAPAPAGPTEARAGWLNTLLSGDRVFTYTADGTPGGKVVREEHMMGPEGGRDAMFSTDARTGKRVPHSSAEAPFYSAARRLKPGETVALEQFIDQPGASVQREVEGSGGEKGKLAKIGGADRFRLSIGIAEVDNASTIHLTAKEWTVPWDATVDQSGRGTGSAISVADFKGRLEDIERGKGYVVGEAEQFPWPQTPEEVKSFSSPELIRAIPYAERQDAASWALMCAELRARNPTCTVTTLVNESTAIVADDLTITIKGPRTATRTTTEWLSAAPVSFRLLDICDPQDLKTGLVVELSVSVEGNTAQPMSWPWPFGALRETRYWWDEGGAPKGEWTDPKGLKRRTQTDITVTASGFG
jgi:hypothetical protein